MDNIWTIHIISMTLENIGSMLHKMTVKVDEWRTRLWGWMHQQQERVRPPQAPEAPCWWAKPQQYAKTDFAIAMIATAGHFSKVLPF